MRSTRFTRRFVAVLALGASAACGSERAEMIDRGFAPAYAEGYEDGCSSGREAGGGPFDDFSRDARRYDGDREYAHGWDAAFEICKEKMEGMVRAARLRRPSRSK
jgi:hypothetical protein